MIRGWMVLSTVFLLLALGESRLNAMDGGGWREEGSDEIASLFVLTQLCGAQGDYEEVRKHMNASETESSIEKIAAVGRSMGFNVRLRKASPSSLESITPVIVFCENDLSGGGEFHLLLKSEKSRVLLLDGRTSRLKWVNNDLFRRTWTGHVVLLERQWWRMPWIGWPTLFLCICVGWLRLKSVFGLEG